MAAAHIPIRSRPASVLLYSFSSAGFQSMFCVREQSTDQARRQIVPLQASDLDAWLDSAGPAAKAWVRAHEFEAEPGSSLAVPDDDGNPSTVLVGFPPD